LPGTNQFLKTKAQSGCVTTASSLSKFNRSQAFIQMDAKTADNYVKQSVFDNAKQTTVHLESRTSAKP